MEDNDIVGNTVRGVVDSAKGAVNSAMEKPRQVMRAASDAVTNVNNRVKSFLPQKPPATWTYDQKAVAPKAPTGSPAKPIAKIPSYKHGTSYVPKTGMAKLHKGEAVIPKEHNHMAGASEELGGHAAKPKKEIKHIVTKKAKTGGYIHEHHHTHPEHHPMEEHVSKDQDAMMDHMMQNMGTPNPGEAEADAGQSGAPGQAPGMGSPAPSGGPTAGM